MGGRAARGRGRERTALTPQGAAGWSSEGERAESSIENDEL